MVLVGVELALGLARVYVGLPDYLTLLILVITTFYLNQRSVRAIVNLDGDPDRHDGSDPGMSDVELLQRFEPIGGTPPASCSSRWPRPAMSNTATSCARRSAAAPRSSCRLVS